MIAASSQVFSVHQQNLSWNFYPNFWKMLIDYNVSIGPNHNFKIDWLRLPASSSLFLEFQWRVLNTVDASFQMSHLSVCIFWLWISVCPKALEHFIWPIKLQCIVITIRNRKERASIECHLIGSSVCLLGAVSSSTPLYIWNFPCFCLVPFPQFANIRWISIWINLVERIWRRSSRF